MRITLIAAMDRERTIGHKGEIPWMGKLPRDLLRFRERTKGKTVVMGRVTFDSIGHALPDRENIVLTKDIEWTAQNVTPMNDPQQLFRRAIKEEVFIIGGKAVYEIFLPYADTLDLAMVDHVFDGDTHFPEFSSREWSVVADEYHPADEENDFPVRFALFTRR